MEPQEAILSIEPSLKIHPDILSVMIAHKIDINDAACYFVEAFNKLKFLPANYKLRKVKKNNIWILRDYYPNTGIMFKMTVVYKTQEEMADFREDYQGQCPDGLLFVNVKLVPPTFEYKIDVPYAAALTYAKDKSVNILLGDDYKPKPFIKADLKPMRRMFPKGYYDNRSNKRSPHLPNKRKKHS